MVKVCMMAKEISQHLMEYFFYFQRFTMPQKKSCSNKYKTCTRITLISMNQLITGTYMPVCLAALDNETVNI